MDPRRLLPFLLGLTLCAVLATAVVVLVAWRSGTDETRAGDSSPAAGAAPRSVLAAWDERRAAAWADGDVEALRDLYVAGSATGRSDARMLAAYVDRGLRVEGLTTQVLALEVLAEEPERLILRVTDRVRGGVVTGAAVDAALPQDRSSTRTVTLRRVDGAWLVVRTRDQASAAASTSRTSTSWKS
ncbi:hypothetical protein [Nocardioides currus]|uniref:SnoaL-like domain-containing protein n=1 Tax=Nocardioides currus TaxID=2133958 RepID=A0A2R7YRZ9_9ACTN|nr:hypothetical protein [Nocardioides currus]PUA79195.1 hypothetical protein C7S10_20915 [Nocardioides currus]